MSIEYTELEDLLSTIMSKDRMSPLSDAQVVTCTALEYWKRDRVPSYKQAYAMACTAYWRMFDRRS